MNLKGKNVLITGGNKGLGKALAIALANEGANIAISGRNQTQLKEVCDYLNSLKIKAVYACFDVSNNKEVEKGVAKVAQELGGIDILINNAGILKKGNLDEMPIEDWEEIININLLGVYYVAKACVPYIKQSAEGDIVNIASTAGLKGSANLSAYCASKAGVIALSESLMAELRKLNIRVMTITPSTIATDLTLNNGITDGNPEKVLQPEDFAQWICDILKMNRRAMIANGSIFSTNP